MTHGFLLTLLLLAALAQPCHALQKPAVPDPLKPWVGWVLHDQEEKLQCVPHYNDPEHLQCNWPAAISLDLQDRGGTFSQSWEIAHESWVSLPGNTLHWPRGVKVDGTPWVVVQKNGTPQVKLPPGTHKITGRFIWSRLPEYLQVPRTAAFIDLRVNAGPIAFPRVDDAGRVWLKAVQREEKIENRLLVESFRAIDDVIPTRLVIHATLDVAGTAREIALGPLYAPEEFIPLSLHSPLPARLEPDARLRIQVRPGRYSFTLTIRHIGPLRDLTFSPPADGFWPSREIWSFIPHPDLRQVEIEGVPPVDPQQTTMPDEWRRFPAYRLQAGESMHLTEVKRGDPDPPPDQLTLNRYLWLRFDGSGYTIQDSIGGRKNTNWRLEMTPAITLGRVAVNGTEQLITRRSGTRLVGIELRNGIVNLSADSIYQGNIAALPATGWQHEFQKVEGMLYLPPGWKLLHAGGIDHIPTTWIKRWTMLDFFIVLIFTIATAKIYSGRFAVLAFATLVLLYHEPGAPRYVWLALLVGFAMLKHLPPGTFRKIVIGYQALVLLFLISAAIPYSIHALQAGIYPQLDKPWISMTDAGQRPRLSPAPAPSVPDTEKAQSVVHKAPAVVEEMRKMAEAPLDSMFAGSTAPDYQSRVMQYDPKALTQTGPGLPRWHPFESIRFGWSGPVSPDQHISFILLGPMTNLVLAFIRVFLIILLGLGMCGISYGKGEGFRWPDLKSFGLFPVVLLFLCFPATTHGAEIPSREMLLELQQRLLEVDDCFPDCAALAESTVTILPDTLSIVIRADAQVETMIPLPGHADHWLPQQVRVDNEEAGAILRLDKQFWVLLPAGNHMVTLTGAIRQQNTVQLPWPLRPHRLTVNATGWAVEGVHADGTFESQLQFRRIVAEERRQTEVLETGVLPPFARVERTLLIGLDWKVTTTIQRLGPTGSAVVLKVPLLPGESVITDGITVDGGKAMVTLQAGRTTLQWQSFLETADTITLGHPDTDDWTEIWQVDVSPIFHMEYEGIPVILHKTGERWYPTWHPWPGEEVRLRISRPPSIGGQTVTVEQSRLEMRPGRRSTEARLFLAVKSSQGGQHTISLPEGAELQDVKIDDTVQPIRQEGRNVPLPLTPGSQDFELQWREPVGISTMYRISGVDLNTQSVNAGLEVRLPRNRWPLFLGGEHLVGPAVLFWTVLIVIVLAAFVLSRTGLTPLGFHHWLLLGIGMAMSNLAACFLVVGWLIALHCRKKTETMERNLFNLTQFGIGVLTIAALAALVHAISRGLLGHPDMNIVGNGSSAGLLCWYHDVSDGALPTAWIFSIPMLAYRLAMLSWALWVSFWLVGILKWGWKRFTEPVLWYSAPPKPKNTPGEVTAQKAEKPAEKEEKGNG